MPQTTAGVEGAEAGAGTGTEALERVALRAMGASQDEAQFSVEHHLPEQPCLWADKYRPRKPRYFNRVHTGFEWNKYNQTHYDMDNPPPKIVQGYKFNIFYPDLIDKNATPEFSLVSSRSFISAKNCIHQYIPTPYPTYTVNVTPFSIKILFQFYTSFCFEVLGPDILEGTDRRYSCYFEFFIPKIKLI